MTQLFGGKISSSMWQDMSMFKDRSRGTITTATATSSDEVTSGGSRISPMWWRQPFTGQALIYDFVKFSQKLHEIERIWTPGGTRPSRPLRSATGNSCILLKCLHGVTITVMSPRSGLHGYQSECSYTKQFCCSY